MDPREFSLTVLGETTNRYTVGDANEMLMSHELERLKELEIGESFIDGDGDTWKRTR